MGDPSGIAEIIVKAFAKGSKELCWIGNAAVIQKAAGSLIQNLTITQIHSIEEAMFQRYN